MYTESRIQSLSYSQGTGHAFTTARAKQDMPCIDITPAEWWMLHGYETPQLTQFAVRVLSQVTSASACKRTRSTHEFILRKKRNLLGASKLADLASIHCNLQLWMKSLKGKTSCSRRVQSVPHAFCAPGATIGAPVVGSSSTSAHHIYEEDVFLGDISEESASSDDASIISQFTESDGNEINCRL